MSRAGTAKYKGRERRAGGKAARLITLFRRAGFVLGFAVLLFWAAAWFWLSDMPQRLSHMAETQFQQFAAAQGFAVQSILVEGRDNTDPDVLRALINVERGDSIFAFDPAEVKELIERISWVREAHVERHLPDTVYIGLVERKPLALWQNKGKVRLIDVDGVTLADGKLEKFAGLVILVGEDAPEYAPELLRLLHVEPALKDRVEAATWVGERRWDLKTKNGISVKLPEGDLGLALRRLAKAQEDDGLLDKDIESVDLREPDRITVRTRPGAVKEYKAGFATGSNI